MLLPISKDLARPCSIVVKSQATAWVSGVNLRLNTIADI
jgi:hypothetical protein